MRCARNKTDSYQDGKRSGGKRPLADIAGGALMLQFVAVIEARTFLLATLRRVIDGGDVTNDELGAAIAAPSGLRGAERKA